MVKAAYIVRWGPFDIISLIIGVVNIYGLSMRISNLYFYKINWLWLCTSI